MFSRIPAVTGWLPSLGSISLANSKGRRDPSPPHSGDEWVALDADNGDEDAMAASTTSSASSGSYVSLPPVARPASAPRPAVQPRDAQPGPSSTQPAPACTAASDLRPPHTSQTPSDAIAMSSPPVHHPGGASSPPLLQSPPRMAPRLGDSPPASPIPDRPTSPDLPLTMTASTVLMGLPRDATTALAAAGGFDKEKVVVRFKAVGSAPAVRRDVCKISATQKFEAVVAYLRRTLRVKETDGVFLYVNSTFAPALDEVVGNLHRCFKDSNDQLNVAYSMTPAFG